VRGRALIENGRLVQEAPELAGTAQVDVTIEQDGRLVLGMACAMQEGTVIGYAATAERHTYFRFRDGALNLVDPDSPDAALEEVAFAFIDEWLWYDEEEAALERARYSAYGVEVRGANLKSEKLNALRASLRFSSLAGAAASAREALRAQWLGGS
jgi:hypothetical protein